MSKNAKPQASAAAPAAFVGTVVLVRTAQPIDGQFEHAGIVTKLCDAGAVNIMVLPPIGEPYACAAVAPEGAASKGAVSWRRIPRA